MLGDDDLNAGTSDDSEQSWTDWFLTQEGNTFFCEVDKAFIGDKFNLTGLPFETGPYKKAYHLILDEDGIYNFPR